MLTENQDFTTPKSFSRLLSMEKKNSLSSTSSAATVAGELDSSFRVFYYGGAAGSVPFSWESQPGTPKHRFSDTPLPPLTPPPSYKFSPTYTTVQKTSPKNSKIFVIQKITSSKKISMSPSFSSSSSHSSSSYSAPSTPLNTGKYSKAKSTSAMNFAISPTSTLCFGNRNGNSSASSSRIKRAFLAIVGHAK